MDNKLPLLAAVLLTFAICALSLPPCPACPSTAVPYPLSTAASYKIRCSSGTQLFNSSNNTYRITSISAAIVAPSSFLPHTCAAADLPSNGLKLNSSASFNITSSNTKFYLNCSESTLDSPLNCTFNSISHVYSTSGCGSVPCCAGGSTMAYRIPVRHSGCRAYSSFVNLNYQLTVSRWPPSGVELQRISPPEPIRTSQGDRGSDSTCKRDPNSNNGVNRRFCESGLQWDLVAGVCANGGGKEYGTALIAGLSVGLGVAVALTALLITFFLYKRRHRRLRDEQERHLCEYVEIVSADGGESAQVTGPPPRGFTLSPPPDIVSDGAQPAATAATQVPNPPPDIAGDGAQAAATEAARVPNPTQWNFPSSPPPDIENQIAQPAAQVSDPLPDIAGDGAEPAATAATRDIESQIAQPAATAATRDIESQIAQPAAQVPDPHPPNSTFSGEFLTICFASAVPSLLLFLELQKQRRFPFSFHLFSVAITCAFVTAFLQKIIPFRPDNKFASLLETMGKIFFAIAFFLAVIIPSPFWLRIVDGVILFFCLVVVFKYRQSSYAVGREPHLLNTNQQDAAAITNRRTQHQPPEPSAASTPSPTLLPLRP